ncbi:MAG: 50S ribosomal protein L21 [Ignavibacteria bacterium]
MFAIVDIKGFQYKVGEDQKIFIPRIQHEAGSKIEFDKVLLYSPDEKTIEIGTPILTNHKIEATVLGHVKDEKVIVFKKKRRKGYKVKKGHRQQYTEVQINKII